MLRSHVELSWWAIGVLPAIAGFVLIFGGGKMQLGEYYFTLVPGGLFPLALLAENWWHYRSDGCHDAWRTGPRCRLACGLASVDGRDVRAALCAHSNRIMLLRWTDDAARASAVAFDSAGVGRERPGNNGAGPGTRLVGRGLAAFGFELFVGTDIA